MEKTLTVILFLLCYLLFAVLPRHRHWVALAGAAVALATGAISWRLAFLGDGTSHGPAVNWNVMGIFFGTLIVAELFLRSGMPAHLADLLIRRAPSARVALLALCAMTGLISMVVENVATVLLIAPVALAVTQRLGIRPVPFFIALAISSNLQSCATLIGDPPSMLLGSAARMNFNDFIWLHGRPSVFFAVQIGAVVSFLVLLLEFRKHRQPVEAQAVEPVKTFVPTFIMIAMILALALSGFFDPGFGYLAGALCMAFGLLALAWDALFHRTDVWGLIRELDWATTVFLVGIFILVGALSGQGVMIDLARWIQQLTHGHLLTTFAALIVIAMLVSAFVDNVPFLVAMIPVVTRLNEGLGYGSPDPSTPDMRPEAYLLFFGLLLGAGLGGNISPIGASANIVAMGLMEKNGYRPGFLEFVRIGLPFTILAVASAAVFVWFVWR